MERAIVGGRENLSIIIRMPVLSLDLDLRRWRKGCFGGGFEVALGVLLGLSESSEGDDPFCVGVFSFAMVKLYQS